MGFIKDILSKMSCHHEWEERYFTKVFEFNSDTRPVERRVTLVCKKCGKIKKIIL